MQVPSLLDLCVQALAASLLAGRVPDGFEHIPDAWLVKRVHSLFASTQRALQRAHAHGAAAAPPPDALKQLLALQAFSRHWQVERLHLLQLPPRVPRALRQIGFMSPRMRHLELDGQVLDGLAWLTDLEWLAELPLLCCLALRGCGSLLPCQLAPLLLLRQLQALDLQRAAQLDDAAASTLAALSTLQVLNLNETRVTDVTVEALTYGARLQAWAKQSGGGQLPDGATWPAVYIHSWHLSRTRVTSAAINHLAALPRVSFLDVRGVGIPRPSLVALERAFGLSLVQGAVLSGSNALAAAIINHNYFPCACMPKPGGDGNGASTPAAVATASWPLLAGTVAAGAQCAAAGALTAGQTLQASRRHNKRARMHGGEHAGRGVVDHRYGGGMLAGAAGHCGGDDGHLMLMGGLANGVRADERPTPGWEQRWAAAGALELIATAHDVLEAEAAGLHA